MTVPYKSYTDNGPECGPHADPDPANRPELKSWGQPKWEIYVDGLGSTEVWACRPTDDEIYNGDLLGDLGSVIRLDLVSRTTMKNALRIARTLCNCPGPVAYLNEAWLPGIAKIETDITLYSFRLL